MAFDDPQYGNHFDTEFDVRLLDGAQPNSVTASLAELGYYQKSLNDMVELFGNKLEGKTVVDINANIGYWTLLLSKLVGPEGTVISIEPASWNFTILAENIRRCAWATNTIPLRCAIVHKKPEGKIPLYHNVYNSNGHSFHTIREGDDDDFEKVNAKTLDDILDDRDKPFLININIDDSIDKEITMKSVKESVKKHGVEYVIINGGVLKT